jgi:hypothetical protein
VADAATPDCDAGATAPSSLKSQRTLGRRDPSFSGSFATPGPTNELAGPGSSPIHAASGPVDHQGNRVVARIDNDDLPAGDQKPKLLQLRRSIQHDLRELVELHVVGYFRAKR